MCHTGARATSGAPLVTWVSPSGQAHCLDYVAYPETWGPAARTHQPKSFDDLFAGLDHQPVYSTLHANMDLACKKPTTSWRALLTSEEGRQTITHAWRTMPQIPWETPIDDHVAIVNQHLFACRDTALAARPAPRAPFLSSDTWALLRHQRRLRRLSSRLKATHRRQLLFALFQTWSNGISEQKTARVAKCAHRAHNRIAQVATLLHRSRKHLRWNTAKDKAEFCRTMFRQARSNAELPKLMRALLRTGRKYKAPPLLPTLPTASGESTQDRGDFLRVLGGHFAKAERATRASFLELRTATRPDAPTHDVALEELPTLGELAIGFAKLKAAKAPGVTSIPAEVFKLQPGLAAITHYPIVIKSAARGQYPALWRGGHAVPIAKAGKDPNSLSGWRSILLLDPAHKAVSHALRPALLEGLDKLVQPGAAGARKGQPLTLPAMSVSLHLARLHQEGVSGAVLFLDGESAFYQTVRAFLHPTSSELSLNEWLNHLCVQGMLPEDWRKLLQDNDILGNACVPPEICHLLRHSLCRTWFTLDPEDGEVYRSSKGTVPGAPLADLLFVLTYTIFVDGLMHDLQAQGMACSLGTGEMMPRDPLPTWMDDTAVLIQVDQPSDVPTALITATNLAKKRLAIIGIPLNLQPGKSGAIVVLHGRGAQTARHHMLIEMDAKLPLGDGTHLHLSETYIHLGSSVSDKDSACGDIRRRAQLTEAAFGAVRAKLLYNPHLEPREKTHLLVSMVLLKFQFGLERWHFATHKEEHQFHAHYMSFVRRAVRPIALVSCRLMTDAQACAAIGVLLPQEARQMQLTRALHQAMADSFPHLHTALFRQLSWLQKAVSATNALLEVIGSDPLPSIATSEESTAMWRRTYLCRVADVAHLCKKARHRWLHSRLALAKSAIDEAKYREATAQQGVMLMPKPTPYQAGSLPTAHACEQCGVLFTCAAAKAAHMSKKHGQHARATSVLRGTACQVCSREFWTQDRLREHLRRAEACLSAYAEADLPPALPQETNIKQATSKPVTALVGPKPFWACLRPPLTATPEAHEFDLRLELRTLLTCPAKDNSLAAAFERCMPKLGRFVATFPETSSVLDDLVFPEGHARVLQQFGLRLAELLSAEHEQTAFGAFRLISFGQWIAAVPIGVDFQPTYTGLA